jgi:hypothetical protein
MKKRHITPGHSASASLLQAIIEFQPHDGVLIPGAVETAQSKARKRFFLKKEAKTFASLCARCGSLNAMRTKVFWFFFSKKNCFLASPAASRNPTGMNQSQRRLI